MTHYRRRFALAFVFAFAPGMSVSAQDPQAQEALIVRRNAAEAKLQSIAVVERKLLMPMRDGVRLATDVYRPKHATGPVPTIFSCAVALVVAAQEPLRIYVPNQMDALVSVLDRRGTLLETVWFPNQFYAAALGIAILY